MTGEPKRTPADADGALAAAGVVHDVNQLLTVIAGRVEILRGHGGVPSAELDAIALAVQDAAAVLRRLAGAAPAPGAAHVATCVAAVAQRHRPPGAAAWGGPGAAWELVTDVPAELVAAVPAAVLREVLGNLVTNAVEAMGAGGRLEVRAQGAAGRVRLTLRDSGPGLAPGARERIFAGGCSQKGGEGRGVGLAACRQLLGAWDATIDAAEPDGGGAVFIVDLPAAADRPVATPRPAPALPLPAPILVVDDEAAVREVLVEVCGAQGLTVQAVGDGAAARRACAELRFAVALVDLTLPGESGEDLARWLRARADGPAVVLMTGLDRMATLAADPHGPADAVAAKPLDFAGLPALLRGAVARAQARRGGVAPEEGSPS